MLCANKQKIYNEQYEYYVQVKKILSTMYINFWKLISLSRLNNYRDVMIHIWDYVIDEECKFIEAQGQAFDEDTFMLERFTNKEILVIEDGLKKIATEAAITKEKRETLAETDKPIPHRPSTKALWPCYHCLGSSF